MRWPRPTAFGHALRGEFLAARTSVAEGVALAAEFGMDIEVAVLRAISVWLAAVAGDEPRCRTLAAEVLPVVENRHHRDPGQHLLWCVLRLNARAVFEPALTDQVLWTRVAPVRKSSRTAVTDKCRVTHE